MNPRQPYPPPYGIPPYQVSPPPKGPPRQVYYEAQQPQPPYYQQSISLYPHQGAAPTYAPPPQMYPQTPSYYGPPYQKQMLYPEQQQPLYVAPPPPAEPPYLGYPEIPQPASIYQRAQPPQPSVLHVQPVQPVQPVTVAKPPVVKKDRQPVGQPKPAEVLKLQVPNRQSLFNTDNPPGEFDMVCRGKLPAIVFKSEVTIKT